MRLQCLHNVNMQPYEMLDCLPNANPNVKIDNSFLPSCCVFVSYKNDGLWLFTYDD